MATGKLSARFVAKSDIDPGRYQDGGGLFLNITKAGSRSWVIRITVNGKRMDIGLGSASTVSLADARDKAREVREQVAAGLDPKAERDRAKTIPTFRDAAKSVFALNKSEWKNPKHRQQWENSLEAYAFPVIGDRRVNEIDHSHVKQILTPIWLEKRETARRVRQRVGFVLDWAASEGHREPFVMSVVNAGLPKGKAQVRHQPAVPWADIPAFAAKLRERETMGRLALEAVLLCATRSGETRLARWQEIDFDKAVWTIPPSHTKTGKPHVVPLSPPALRLFERAAELKLFGVDLVFPGAKRGKPLSDATLLKVMRDLGMDAVPHGLRSSFRDWVAETTDYPNDLAEAALAHTIRNKVEAAYRRGPLLEKRRRLMADWGAYCGGDSAQS